MTLSKAILATGLTLGLSLTAPAQVAPGEGVRFSHMFGAAGMEFLDTTLPAAVVTPVVGVDAIGIGAAGFIDPINGNIIAPGSASTSTGGNLYRYFITGSTLQGNIPISTTVGGPNSRINDTAIDHNGNYIVLNSDELWSVDRTTGQGTLISGTFRTAWGSGIAVAVDKTLGRVYVSTNGGGSMGQKAIIEYDLNNLAAPEIMTLDVTSIGVQAVSALASDNAGSLYFAIANPSTTLVQPAVHKLNVFTGTYVQLLQNATTNVADMYIHWQTGFLHTQNSNADTDWLEHDEAGGTTTLVDAGPGIGGIFSPKPWVTGIAFNDFMHTTTVFPSHGSSSAGFLVEIAAHGNAGDLAGVALTAINGAPIPPMILGSVGTCNASGTFDFWSNFASGFLPAGTQLTFVAGTLDAGTGSLTLAPAKTLFIDA